MRSKSLTRGLELANGVVGTSSAAAFIGRKIDERDAERQTDGAAASVEGCCRYERYYYVILSYARARATYSTNTLEAFLEAPHAGASFSLAEEGEIAPRCFSTT